MMENLKKALRKWEGIPREEYFLENQRLADSTWEKELVPTVADIAEFISGEKNEHMSAIFDFFENEDDFNAMAHRQGETYSESESQKFIQSVMSSNNTDISEAGYFYKLLMASADDFIIVENDCGCEGVLWKLDDITPEVYSYRIKWSWINELKKYARFGFEAFIQECKKKGLDHVHIRTPLECGSFPHETGVKIHNGRRGICKKCAGALPAGTTNVGAFTTLMVTENATQSALNSMNKGKKENVNNILTRGYPGESNWDDIKEWINSVVHDLTGGAVFARFYEIALMSRIRFDRNGPYIASLQGSINRSGNLMGSYIFTPTNKTFQKVLKAGRFNDSSLKLQIAMNQYLGGR